MGDYVCQLYIASFMPAAMLELSNFLMFEAEHLCCQNYPSNPCC